MDPGIEQDECAAARAVLDLAEQIHDVFYYREGQEVAPATIRAFHKCYRAIRSVVNFYWGAENVPLVWDPPSTRFQKAKAKHA